MTLDNYTAKGLMHINDPGDYERYIYQVTLTSELNALIMMALMKTLEFFHDLVTTQE